MSKALVLAVLVGSSLSWSQSLKLSVTLNPAGDFVAESNQVSGFVTEGSDGMLQATDVKLPVKSLKSGISLRDDHMVNKYLEASKYPEITMKIAKGKNGNGVAILVVKGKEAKVKGTYTVKGDKISASFPVKISGFGIEDISYKGIGVDDEVKVEVELPIKKTASSSVKPKAANPAERTR